MDKIKLHTAADNDHIKHPRQHHTYTFKHGAEWLLTQPLSERLTDAEKQCIKEHWDAAHDTALNGGHITIDDFKAAFKDIFGEELFHNE